MRSDFTRFVAAVTAALVVTCRAVAAPQPALDDVAAVRALAEQFVSTQEREDAAAYLALWSPGSPSIDRMRRMARFLFTKVDYRFTNPTIDRLQIEGNRATVRVIADREIVDSRDTQPGGEPIVRTYRGLLASVLTCVKEDGIWRVWEDHNPIQDLAESLVRADAAERERLLQDNARLVSRDLRMALASRADQLYAAQAYDSAMDLMRLVERVAREAGDREGLASAYGNLGNIHYMKREYPEALGRYRQRLDLEQALDNQDGVASARLGMATTEYSQGDYTTALGDYERALAIRETRDDQTAIADLLVGLGNVRFLLGDYQPALDAYGRAQIIYERGVAPPSRPVSGSISYGRAQLMRVLQGVGRVRTAQGDYRAALEVYTRALELATAAGDRAGTANTLSSLADVRRLQGHYEESVDLYRRTADLANALGDRDLFARARAGVGLAELLRNRAASAAEAYQQAYAAYEIAKDPDGKGRALVGLGFAQGTLDQFADAVSSYDRAIELFGARNGQEDIGRALIGRAMAQAGLGRHDRELTDAERAVAIAAAIANTDLAWRAATQAGHANLRLGRIEAARAAFTSAITTVEAVRRDVGAGADVSALDDRAAPYLGMMDLLAGAGDPRGAFDYAERARAQVRWDLLARSPVAIDRGMAAADRVEERDLAHEIISLRTQFAKVRELPRPDAAVLAALDARLGAARERLAAFRQRIDAALPDLARWRGQSPALDAGSAQALVAGAETVALEYVVTDDGLHIFAITNGGISHHLQDISRKDLATRVSLALEPASLASREAWRGPAGDLSDLLLAPVKNEIAGKRLVIVMPDGVLWRVPFEALDAPAVTVEPGGPARALVEDAAVAYVTSATTWQYARDQDRARPAAVGGSLELLAFGGGDRAGDLRAAAAVYGEGRAAVHLSDAALEAHLREESAGYPVLQLGEPGSLDDASPLYSRMPLGETVAAGETPHENDGVLEAWELLSMTATPGVAVCTEIDWPAGTLAGGDGVTGLSWAWLAAGTPTIVISRWSVPGPARAALLLAWHRELAGSSVGGAPHRAQALRAAILQLMRTPGSDAPLHWAGFMMVGHPD